MFNNTSLYPPYAADCNNQPGIISYIDRTSRNTPYDHLFGHIQEANPLKEFYYR